MTMTEECYDTVILNPYFFKNSVGNDISVKGSTIHNFTTFIKRLIDIDKRRISHLGDPSTFI